MNVHHSCRECLFAAAVVAALLANGGHAHAQTGGMERCAADVCYVEITGSGFSPEELVIKSGSIVVWKNVDNHIHMIKSGIPEDETNLFDSGLLERHEAHGHAFMEGQLGSHDYFDRASGHTGRIIVEEQFPGPNSLKIDVNDQGSGIESNVAAGGRIASAEIDPEGAKLTMVMDNQAGHEYYPLEVSLDRQLIDSQKEGEDVPFSVMVDGQMSDAEELPSTQDERTLRIPVTGEAGTVEIVGSSATTEPNGYKEAQQAMTDGRRVIADYKQEEIVLTKSENMLLEAQRAFDNGRYLFAEYLAGRAADNAHATNDMALAAGEALAEAEDSFRLLSSLGLDSQHAEEGLAQITNRYDSGQYDEAFGLATQAKAEASSRIDRVITVLGIIAVAAVAVVLQAPRFPRRVAAANSSTSALEQILSEKQHLRETDKQVLRYIFESGGVTLSEIRSRFAMPTSSSWRLARRLEREELVRIERIGNQNHVSFASGPRHHDGAA